MLKNNEIVTGALYAWDSSVVNPPIGCNLFTIIGLSNDLVNVDSVDGYLSMCISTHCLITEENALKRLNVLRSIDIEKESKDDEPRKWSYDRELKYLTMFESALNKYKNSSTK